MRKILLPVLLSSTMLCQNAVAQDDTTELAPVLVTASRSAQSVSTVAQSVMVIDRQAIEQEMALSQDAADLISRRVPGFAPHNQTISGASETFRGRSVLVMVDGVPRGTPLRDVSRILSMIDLNTVERVEIVNGASSLYGSGATGGTINFITKRGTSTPDDKPKVTVTTGVTGFTKNLGKSAAPQANVTVEGAKNGFDYFLSLSGERTRLTYDGAGREMPSDAMLGQGGGDRLKLGNVNGVLGYELSPSQRLEFTFDITEAEQKPDWFTNYATSPVTPNKLDPYTGEPLKEDSKYFSTSYTDSDFSLGELSIKGFYNNIEKQSPYNKISAANSQVYYSGNLASPTSIYNQTVLNSERAGLNATVTSPLDFIKDGAKLTWGMDYTYDHTKQQLVNGQDVISPMTQNSIGLFAQAEVPVTERFRLQGGVRFDQFFLDVDSFQRPTSIAYPATSSRYIYPAVNVLGGSFDYSQATFNVGGVFDITHELQLFGNFSQGYSLTDIGGFTRRAGTNSSAEMCDAYGSLSGVKGCTGAADYTISYANIAPEPQLVNTYEAGLRGNWANVRGSISGYISTSNNGTAYDVASNTVSQQKERIWGFEASGEYDLSSTFTLGASAGYVEGRYDANKDGRIASNEYLPNNRIPTNWKGLTYVTAHLDDGITARAEMEFFSGRDRIATQELDGAALFNVSVAKTFDNKSTLTVGVRNLFDREYVNPTASATRGVDVMGLGRTIVATYKVTF